MKLDYYLSRCECLAEMSEREEIAIHEGANAYPQIYGKTMDQNKRDRQGDLNVLDKR